LQLSSVAKASRSGTYIENGLGIIYSKIYFLKNQQSNNNNEVKFKSSKK
jgi:hypothetical protein